ncbi:MAG: hypothetical protein J3R72DRAFT_478845 [Linnemannia gamsii]|nr:MAG: hypothetical protein J3R72DRAFT_478845 [Linnemannia gamsii]
MMITILPLHRQLRTIAWLWGTLCLLTATQVSAQSTKAQPESVDSMAYATVDEKTFYVHGGHGDSNDGLPIHQFFSLDLTQDSWNVSSPPWRQLTFPSNFFEFAESDHSLLVTPDGRTLTVWSGQTVADYSITAKKWTKVPVSQQLSSYKLRAATDPTTGTVYIPAGFVRNAGVEANTTSMVKYNVASGISGEPLPPSVAIYREPVAFVWSKVRKSFFMYTDRGDLANPFYEYTPSNGQWKELQTTGPKPPHKVDSCMVPAYEGTKMILFGGDTIGDIYILDVPTMEWIQGQSATSGRSSMACTVAGDNFISWGGVGLTVNKKTEETGTPLIYDISSNQWVQKYIRRTSYKPSSAPSPSPTNGSTPPRNAGEGGGEGEGESKGVNAAAIGGGTAGAIAAITAIAFLVIRRRRQNRGQHNTKHSNVIPYHGEGSPSMDNTSIGLFAYMRSNWNQRRKKPSNPQLILRNDPQSSPSSPQSTASPPLASSSSLASSVPVSLPRPSISFQSTDRQTRARSMDQQLLVIQEQIGAQRNNPHFIRNDPQSTPNSPESTASSPLGPIYSTLDSPRPGKPFKSTDRQKQVRSMDPQLPVIQEQVVAHRNNPQYDPAVDWDLSPSTARVPQGGQTEPISETSMQELRHQIQSLEAELSRRKVT